MCSFFDCTFKLLLSLLVLKKKKRKKVNANALVRFSKMSPKNG